MRKNKQQAPLTPKQKWKQSAGYSAGSGGSDYAKKKKRQQDGEQDSVLERVTAGPSQPLPQKHAGPSLATLAVAFEGPSRSASTSAAKSFNWEASTFTTPAFNGAANSRVEFFGVRFPPISGPQAAQPCFLTAEKQPDRNSSWTIKRHVGYVRDGVFKGRTDEAQACEVAAVIVETLASWAAKQSFKSSQPNMIDPKAQFVTANDTIDARYKLSNRGKRSSHNEAPFGTGGYRREFDLL